MSRTASPESSRGAQRAAGERRNEFAGLHVLADDDPRWRWSPLEQAQAACDDGAAAVQLRAKHATDREALRWGEAIREATRARGRAVRDERPLRPRARCSRRTRCTSARQDLPPERVRALRRREARDRALDPRRRRARPRARASRWTTWPSGPVFGTTLEADRPRRARASSGSPRRRRAWRRARSSRSAASTRRTSAGVLRGRRARRRRALGGGGAPTIPRRPRERLARAFEARPVSEPGLRAALGRRAASRSARSPGCAAATGAACPGAWSAWGVGLQLALGALLLRTEAGRRFFVAVNDAVDGLVRFTDAGTRFMFGPLQEVGLLVRDRGAPHHHLHGLAVRRALPPRHRAAAWCGVLARALARSMGLSGAESLAAVANIFVGMTEAPLMVRPYLERMTRSELFCVMTTGMATIAGSVLVAYAKMLGEHEYAGHLVTASLLVGAGGRDGREADGARDGDAGDRRRRGRAGGAQLRQRDRRRRRGRDRRAAARGLRRRAADRLRRAGRDGERGRRARSATSSASRGSRSSASSASPSRRSRC